MLRRLLVPVLDVLVIGAFIGVLSAQSRPGVPQQPARDTPAARRDPPPPPTAVIAGHVLGAEDGLPVKRALVTVSSPELQEERTTLSGDNGAFELTTLPGGRYTVTVYKPGYIVLSYGQRRPLQPGSPLDVGNGVQMRGVDFRLPRGSVVAGHVYDPDNAPLAGVYVQAMHYLYTAGVRSLTTAGNALTDDTGGFRIWGLNPGDYYVTATARNYSFEREAEPGPGVALAGAESETRRAYLPTFYPGVGSVNQAGRVRVGIGGQALDLNFSLQLVRSARVSGIVLESTGAPAAQGGSVSLSPEQGTVDGRSPLGLNFGGLIQEGGTFAVNNVPPDRYTLRARGADPSAPHYASQPLTVAGGDVSGVTVVISPGSTIAGKLTFEGKDSPEPTQVILVAPSADGAAFPGAERKAAINKDGTFQLSGVPAGLHFLRVENDLRGWALKSVFIDKRDVVDTPVELRAGQELTNVNVVISNKQGEINGTVMNQQAVPIFDLTVLAFPVDQTLWRPQARHFMTARPDQTGRFRLRGLPLGDYYLVTVDLTEQGEWFEPAFLEQQRAGAARVTLEEGDVKTHDFLINIR